MIKRIVLLMCLLSGTIGSTFGAGFDCKKASAPIEKAICTNAELSLADDVLTESYRFLISSCQALPGNDALKALQKKWLAEVKEQFTDDKIGLENLKKRYEERNAYLTRSLAQCSQLRTINGPVIVKTISNKKLGYTLPYIVASSPEIGRRINNALFQRLLDIPAPGKLSDGLAGLDEHYLNSDNRPLVETGYTVILNDGRLLVLEINGEGCGAHCESFTEQLLFDVRTGRAVQPEDMFTDTGANALAQRLKSAQIRRGKVLIAEARKKQNLEKDEEETYLWCLRNWSEFDPRLWPMAVNAKGQWHFVAGNCSAHVNRGSDLLDHLDEIVTVAQLEPHLNAYGKSLLMGVGDVRDPAPAELQCKKNGQPPRAKIPPESGDVVSVAAGDEHHLLVQKNGRLWAWGRNYEGQLGNDVPMSGSGEFHPPSVVGEDFVQVAAGMNNSAGIRRDGTLWMWGSNYMGGLGDGGSTNQSRPVQIGKDFLQVMMDSYTSLALQRNGTLWTWGGEQLSGNDQHGRPLYRLTPRQLATDVTQMEFFAPYAQAIALKTDGSVWVFSKSGAKKIGDGFTRLAARNAKAAFKADGTLWAWDETLTALKDTQGRLDVGPAEVGQGFVMVKVAHPNFLVALKADGSLWATHARGQSVSIEPVDCGFKDVVALGSADSSPPHGVVVIALKDNGSLVAWANWKSDKRWQTQQHLFNESPVTLGDGFVKLYQVADLWGNLGARIVALKADGSVWQSEKIEVGAIALPDNLLKKVEFPKTGFVSLIPKTLTPIGTH